MIEGISPHQLRRYVAMRTRFDSDAKTIASITSMLARYQSCGDDQLAIDPVALGHLNALMEHCVLNLWEVLDDFIYLQSAEAAIAELPPD